MPKRRKVTNMLGLAVLSAVVLEPMHPYEIASVLHERGKDKDMPIKWGSLYTVVQNLEKHGFLAVAATTREGGRPERTVYRITDAGHRELIDWTRELLGSPRPERPRFKAGLSVLAVLSPDEVETLLRQRLASLEHEITAQRRELAHASREVPRLFLVEAEYHLTIQQAEAQWVRSFLDELSTGSLPGLTQWRAFHATGTLPPGFAELAARGRPDNRTQPARPEEK